MRQHVIASGILSGGIYALTRSPEAAAGSFVTGIFMDLDHIFDYWVAHPFKMDIAHFFETCEEYKLPKTYLILHSFELVVPLGLLAYFTRSPWLMGFLLGWIPHIIFDHFMNRTYPLSYFFVYRMVNKFNITKVFLPPSGRTERPHGKD
jgi:hypothetical protein